METLMYTVALASLISEGFLVAGFIKKRGLSALFAGISVLSGGFSAGALLVYRPSYAVGVILLLQIVRYVNPLRFVERRMSEKELLRRSRRTYLVTTLLTLVVLLYIVKFDQRFAVSITAVLYISATFSLLLAVSVFMTRTIFRYRVEKNALQKLPTVSVCIPARNETADLPLCIERVLASTYPKLEILVLDDCSHDKTPEIIKKYAHEGVRFINGKEPRDDWVAKNAAYDRLSDEARGEVLMFIGVDVRLEANAITELVAQLGTDDMLSVLPRRSPESESAFFIQPIRYWWELGLWRFIIHHPPVLSTCWLIRREALTKLGTFESVKKAVEPEAVFARSLYRQKKYAFLVANHTIGVESMKLPHDQYITALRKRYSQLKRRPENIFIMICLELLLFTPWIAIPFFIINEAILPLFVSSAAVLVTISANIAVFTLALRKMWLLGIFSFPFLILADVALMIRSLYAYEFGTVIWKERNICLPLLTVEKSLPKY